MSLKVRGLLGEHRIEAKADAAAGSNVGSIISEMRTPPTRDGLAYTPYMYMYVCVCVCV